MAKVVKIKVKNSEGLYDNLIPQSASSAEYGTYASLDTSKGTIEDRLSKLAHREGTVSWTGLGSSVNVISREGNYCILNFVTISGSRYNFNYYANDSGTWATITNFLPINFRPQTQITGYCKLNGMIKISSSSSTLSGHFETKFNPDGSINIRISGSSAVTEAYTYILDIYSLGYKAAPIE